MRFSFDEKDSSYQCRGANAATTDYYDSLEALGTSRYIFSNGKYTDLVGYSPFNPNNCIPIITEVYDANAKASNNK